MANNDLIIILAAGGGVALAYAANIGGFRDWLNSLGGGFDLGPILPGGAGSSGNCTWDTTGHYCWASSACGGACKICSLVGRTTNTSTGCQQARASFLKNANASCPSCKRKAGIPTAAPPAGCPQCTTKGTRAVKINGRCTCEKVPNPLGLYARSYNTNAYPEQSITVS